MKETALRDSEVSILGATQNLTIYSAELCTPQDSGFACKDRLPAPILFCDPITKPNKTRKSKLSRNNKITATKISQ